MNKRIIFFVFFFSSFVYQLIGQGLETVIQNGHLSVIKTVAYTPDGNFLLTGSRDKTIKLWEVATGREMRTFFGHESTVNDLTVSPDGKTFMSSGADGIAIQWDILTGKLIQSFDQKGKLLTSVALSPDGKLLVTAGYDSKAFLWDIIKGDTLRTFKVNADQGLGYGVDVTFSPDGKTVYFGNDNRSLTAFEVASGKQLFDKKPEQGWCGGCATFVAKSASTIVSTSNGAPLAIRDLQTGEIKTLLRSKADDTRHVSITENGLKIIYLTDDYLTVFTNQGDSLFSIPANEQINEATFSPDGKIVATADDKKLINLYDSQTGELTQTIGGYSAIQNTGGLDYDGDSRWDYYIKKYTDLKNDFALSPDGKYLAKAKIGDVVRIWDVESGQIISELRGHKKAVLSVAFTSAGNEIITGSADGTLKRWEVMTGREVQQYEGHREVVFYVALSEDNSKIISGSWDGSAKVWDLNSGDQLSHHVFENSSPYKIEFYKNDIYAFVANLDKTLNLYELDSKKIIREFVGHTNIIHGFDYSEEQLISVSWDGTVKSWNVNSGLQDWRHHLKRPLYAVDINNQGEKVAVAGETRVIHIYNSKDGHLLQKLEGHHASVTNLKFSANDQRLVSSSEDGMIKIWDLESGKELVSYIVFDKNDWMAINDQGYFNTTEGAFDKVAFIKGMETYGAGQFFNKFYKPDLLKKTFSQNSKRLNLEQQLEKSPPPSLEFLAPHTNETLKTASVDILLKLEDQGGGVKKVYLKHNNKLIEERDVDLRDGKAIVSFTLPLIVGTNTIEASAINEAGIESSIKSVKVTKEGKLNTSLYLFAIGINHYENESLNLNYARADAEGFVKLIAKKSKPLFDKVEVITLMDEEATKEKIFERLNLLSKVIKPQDVLFFYYAGHGSMVDDNFYFVPTDNVKLYSEEKLQKNGIEASEMQDKLREIAALKQLVIIDACQSGGSVELLAQRGAPEEKALAQLSRSVGIHVLAAAGSEQFATEFSDLGHGLFTYVLLEALSGKADGAPADGKVTIYELKSYLDDQVPEYSKKHKGKMQFPHTFSRGQDFPIVIEK